MSGPNKRILRDIHHVTSVSNTVLANAGIYYHADETSAFHGTALIVGQKGTPYHGGFYFFDIVFPSDYPFSPLRVKTLTQDGKTRFNPNMYLDGKVCLSILNRWTTLDICPKSGIGVTSSSGKRFDCIAVEQ